MDYGRLHLQARAVWPLLLTCVDSLPRCVLCWHEILDIAISDMNVPTPIRAENGRRRRRACRRRLSSSVVFRKSNSRDCMAEVLKCCYVPGETMFALSMCVGIAHRWSGTKVGMTFSRLSLAGFH